MNDYKGKSVIVTGGARGIGKAVAKEFFSRGASVFICALEKKSVDAACREIDPTGKRFLGMRADVSKFADCKKLVSAAVKKFGTVDALINNAGTNGEIGAFEQIDVKKWAKTMETNLLGTMHCARLVVPIMKKAGHGKIVNYAGAGVGGKKTMPHFSAYYASKMAVAGFTETLADELSKYNIQVNCIAPGPVNTYLTDHVIALGPEKAGEELYRQSVEQKKSGGVSPELAAHLIAFLCSSEADNVTGRLLSAKWDSTEALKKIKSGGDLYKLRRIDNDLFYGK